RRGAGSAQSVQAVHFRTRVCSGESRQLEYHPRTGIQFRHADRNGRPFGGHLDLGPRAYVGCSVGDELLAVAADDDRRLCGCNRLTGESRCATTAQAETDDTAVAADVHAPDIALAHRSVPGGFDLASFVDRDPLVAENEGIGNTADRA